MRIYEWRYTKAEDLSDMSENIHIWPMNMYDVIELLGLSQDQFRVSESPRKLGLRNWQT
jgi:hypothetical protein